MFTFRQFAISEKKKNEDLDRLEERLFFLFDLFLYLFWSFSHSNNLEATIAFNLYLKFVKG